MLAHRVPNNLESAFMQLETNLTAQEIKTFKACEDVNQYHFSLGLSIRNAWGLWARGDFYHYLYRLGLCPEPDSMSSEVIELFQQMLIAMDLLQKLNSLEKIVIQAENIAKEWTKADKCSIFLWSNVTQEVQIISENKDLMASNVILGDKISLSSQVWLSDRSLNIPFDAYYHSIFQPEKLIFAQQKYRLCSYLGLPIRPKLGQQKIGIIQLYNKDKMGNMTFRERKYAPKEEPDVAALYSTTYSAPPERWQTSFSLLDEEMITIFTHRLATLLVNRFGEVLL
ncbi:DUF6794 domain-containing protein [Aerosakkonemataceae cyanobacterium BLCC-F50]|uniref:DUF6794 domain-containing protein n=1 Tax=Floridaenema flaviceps BLCC-F50 TaxID=3153642 RepID=A0ABV4XRY4_9CYAN